MSWPKYIFPVFLAVTEFTQKLSSFPFFSCVYPPPAKTAEGGEGYRHFPSQFIVLLHGVCWVEARAPACWGPKYPVRRSKLCHLIETVGAQEANLASDCGSAAGVLGLRGFRLWPRLGCRLALDCQNLNAGRGGGYLNSARISGHQCWRLGTFKWLLSSISYAWRH